MFFPEQSEAATRLIVFVSFNFFFPLVSFPFPSVFVSFCLPFLFGLHKQYPLFDGACSSFSSFKIYFMLKLLHAGGTVNNK